MKWLWYFSSHFCILSKIGILSESKWQPLSAFTLTRDIRIENRRGRNLRYRAREKEVAIRAPVVSLSHVSVKREEGGAYLFFVFETFRQLISANVRERQPGPLMQLLYRTRYRSCSLPNRIFFAFYSNVSMTLTHDWNTEQKVLNH